MYEADGPPKGAPVADPIPCRPIDLTAELRKGEAAVRAALPQLTDVALVAVDEQVLMFAAAADASADAPALRSAAGLALEGAVADYAFPSAVEVAVGTSELPRSASGGALDAEWLEAHRPKVDETTVRPR